MKTHFLYKLSKSNEVRTYFKGKVWIIYIQLAIAVVLICITGLWANWETILDYFKTTSSPAPIIPLSNEKVDSKSSSELDNIFSILKMGMIAITFFCSVIGAITSMTNIGDRQGERSTGISWFVAGGFFLIAAYLIPMHIQ